MIKIGQIYQENDPRFVRKVKITAIFDYYVEIENEAGRKTKTHKKRFNKQSRGNFRLLQDVE